MSDESTLDQGAKDRVREALLAHVRRGAEVDAAGAEDERAGADLDPRDGLGPGEEAQAFERVDLEGLLDDSATYQDEQAAAVEALDFSVTSTVRPGAVVGFGGERFVLGIATSAFEVDGTYYEGISSDAPIGAAIEGLSVGDEFTVNDFTHTIDFVA